VHSEKRALGAPYGGGGEGVHCVRRVHNEKRALGCALWWRWRGFCEERVHRCSGEVS
jgi:hypothetical protein